MIAEQNIEDMIRFVAGLEKGATLENVNLSEAAEAYLTTHGMTAEAIAALREKLK